MCSRGAVTVPVLLALAGFLGLSAPVEGGPVAEFVSNLNGKSYEVHIYVDGEVAPSFYGPNLDWVTGAVTDPGGASELINDWIPDPSTAALAAAGLTEDAAGTHVTLAVAFDSVQGMSYTRYYGDPGDEDDWESETTFNWDQVFGLVDTGTANILYEVGDAGTPAVPEPSSIAMFGIGALGLFGYSRHRRQTPAAA